MSRQKSILILMTDFSGTGVPRVTLRLAAGLAELGYDVELLVLNPRGPMLDQVGVLVKIVPLSSARAITALPKLSRYLRMRKPDVVIAAEDQLGIVAAAACLISGSDARLLVTSHVPYSRSGIMCGLKGWIFKTSLRVLWSRIDIFSTVSKGLADDMSNSMGIPRDQIHVLHNAVIQEADIQRKPDPTCHPFFKTASKVIVGIGSLHPRKGFQDLIEAFRIANEKADLKLIILGEGHYRKALEQQIKIADLTERVDLVGYCSDPFRYLQTADLFVLASHFEGLPTVLIEALACGCPCVATDCLAGPREILADGMWGELVEVKNTEELAEAILTSIANPLDIETLQKRASDFTDKAISRKADALLKVGNK